MVYFLLVLSSPVSFLFLFCVLFAFLSNDEAQLTLFMAERVDGFDVDVASELKEKGMMVDGWLDDGMEFMKVFNKKRV